LDAFEKNIENVLKEEKKFKPEERIIVKNLDNGQEQ